MKKLIALLICCTALLAGCAGAVEEAASEPAVSDTAAVSEPAENSETVPAADDSRTPADELEALMKELNDYSGDVYVCVLCNDKCGNLDEMIADSDVIVRATPIETVSESPFGVWLTLKIEESSKELPSEIKLSLPKNGITLSLGNEVVLALEYFEETDDYGVTGVECGIFRAHNGKVKNAVCGKFMDDLIERYPNARPKDELTTREVFAMLKGLAK